MSDQLQIMQPDTSNIMIGNNKNTLQNIQLAQSPIPDDRAVGTDGLMLNQPSSASLLHK